MADPKKLFLVDGSNQAFRSLPSSPTCAPDGFPTQALFGYQRMLKMVREHQPDFVPSRSTKG